MKDPNQLLDEILFKLHHRGFIREGGIHTTEAINEAKEKILAHFIPKQTVVEAIKKMEQQGHGGGNWRRLLIQLREKLGL